MANVGIALPAGGFAETLRMGQALAAIFTAAPRCLDTEISHYPKPPAQLAMLKAKGYKHVSYHKGNANWVAQKSGKYIGCADTEEEVLPAVAGVLPCSGRVGMCMQACMRECTCTGHD